MTFRPAGFSCSQGSYRERHIYSRQDEEISLVNACTTVTGDDIFSWILADSVHVHHRHWSSLFALISRGIGNCPSIDPMHYLSLLTMAAPVASGILALNLVALDKFVAVFG